MTNRHLIKSLIIILFAGIMLCACSEEPKVKISNLIFNEQLTTAYANEQPFTGSAWSVDGSTMRVNCNIGRVTSIELYHSNGELAMRSHSLTKPGKTYDEKGNEIPFDEFVKKYPTLINTIKETASTILVSPDVE